MKSSKIRDKNQFNLFENKTYAQIEELAKEPVPEQKEEKVKPISDKEAEKAIATIDKRLETAQKKADNINTEVSGNWTPKRGREAEGRRKDKEDLLGLIHGLEQIKAMWEGRTIPEELKKVRSVNDIEHLQNLRWLTYKEDDYDHYKERVEKYQKTSKRLGVTEANYEVIQLLMKDLCAVEKSEEEIKADKLREALNNVRGKKFPGFFPTTDPLIDKMIDYAKLAGYTELIILEPSAGIGNIADKIRERDYDHDIHCVEIIPELVEILRLKGYETVAHDDILEADGFIEDTLYDRIIMNPPFERGQDIQHIQHCYKYLKPGGILVSVASNGVTYNSQMKYQKFRDFVDENGYFVELEGNEFAGPDAFNRTGVRTVLVILEKDG